MLDRPRVLQVGPDPDIGGGMAAALRGLLVSPLAERFQLEVVPTYRGSRPLRRLAIFLVALARIVVWSVRGRGRIVHIHVTVRGSSYRKSVCVLLAKALRRRVVLQVHSGGREIAEFRRRLGWPALLLIRTAFHAADAVVAVSAAGAEALRDAYGIEAVGVISNPAPSVAPFKRQVDPGQPPLVAYLGGFANPIKGGAVLVEAIGKALIVSPGLRFALAGPGDLPIEVSSLVTGSSLTWEGWLGPVEKEKLLRRAEIFVIPSLSEGLPMALLEAMSYRLAVVATAVGGIPEVVESGREVLLVDPGDANQLASALSRLATDPDLRRELAAAAGRRVESFAPAVVAVQVEAVYDALLASA